MDAPTRARVTAHSVRSHTAKHDSECRSGHRGCGSTSRASKVSPASVQTPASPSGLLTTRLLYSHQSSRPQKAQSCRHKKHKNQTLNRTLSVLFVAKASCFLWLIMSSMARYAFISAACTTG